MSILTLVGGPTYGAAGSGGGSTLASLQSNFAPGQLPGATGSNIATGGYSGPSTVVQPTDNTGYTAPGGTGYTAPVDPYSAAQHAALNALPGALNNVYSSASDAGNNSGLTYKNNINDFVTQSKLAQQAIDQGRTGDYLAKQQGTQGILQMVGQGIKSGGVTLANRNAGTSSAAEALAQAYGQLGRQQLSGVGNQFAQAENKQNIAQTNADQALNQGKSKLEDSKTQIIAGIVAAAQQQLQQIDQNMIYASLPNRIDMEAEKTKIRNTALQQLSQFDGLLNNGVSSITPESGDQARVAAASMAQQGIAPENAFQYTTDVPAQFQNTGPTASSLPIYTFPGSKKTT